MKIELQNILLLTQKEILDSQRNRWFVLYTIIFAALSLGLSWFGLTGLGNYGLSGFGRTTASMINLILLIVPLMGLTLGAISLAGEREHGTLLYILAQPVDPIEVLTGKFMGVGIALLGALALGFGISGFMIAWYGGATHIGSYLGLVGLTFLLGLVTLGMGLLISSALSKANTAVGVSLFFWLILVFFGDLGIMGTALIAKFDIQHLFYVSLLNPLQVFKIAAISILHSNLEILGPVGTYAIRTYGDHLLPLLVSILFAWVVITFLGTQWLFKRKGGI
ncbi:MAG: ABC transporter permease [Calditrichaeota bacterium]|nr:MAG: ABC transporter permease [Calditrichota bacterium]